MSGRRLEHWLLNNNVDVFFVFQTLFSLAIRYGTLVLGPVLIVLACTIASGLFYLDFTMILPLLYPNPTGYPLGYLLHLSTSCFFLGNVVFNYFMCVTTRNDGRHYDRVVRELAAATDYEYPETEEEALAKRKDFEKRIVERNKANRRRAAERERKQMEAARHLLGNMDPDTSDEESAGQPNTEGQLSAEGGEAVDPQTPVRSWQVVGSHDWSFCLRSNRPKPPRSHYDGVTKTLVLNMDHYCPWMANCVGYFNYRYFLNFLIYVWAAMVYAVIISYPLFKLASLHRKIRKGVPKDAYTAEMEAAMNMTREQRQDVTFAFMLCLSVGLAVKFLLGFHIFLAATSQTTIEFHVNVGRWRRSRFRGLLWTNPYDLGWRRNLQQVYGRKLNLACLLPSRREPEYLPLPLPGARGVRVCNTGRNNKEKDEEGADASFSLRSGAAAANPFEGDDTPLLQRGGRQQHAEVISV